MAGTNLVKQSIDIVADTLEEQNKEIKKRKNKNKSVTKSKIEDKKQGYSGKMPALLWQQFTEINAKSGTPNAVKINQLVAEYVANHE